MAVSAIFPIERLFHPLSDPGESELIASRLAELPGNPLSLSQFNQLLHRTHQAGMGAEFFSFYFLLEPDNHPFRVPPPPLVLNSLTSIQTIEQLRWGIERFALDAAFFFGDFRNAYRDLRTRSYEDISDLFSDLGRFPIESLRIRGPVMPLRHIPIGDRHLVSELACKALDPVDPGEPSVAESLLISAFSESDGSPVELRTLAENASSASSDDLQVTAGLSLVTEDVGNFRCRVARRHRQGDV